MTTVKNGAAKSVQEAREALAKAEAELAEMEALTQDQQFAIDLHKEDCNYAYCGWSFESKDGEEDWDGRDHQFYLLRARKIMAEYPQLEPEDFMKIVEMVNHG